MREERNFFNRVSEFLGRYFVALVVLTNPRDIFIGCLAQFTIMPLGAFFLAKIFNLPIGNVCSPK